jgi:hypothetical protein
MRPPTAFDTHVVVRSTARNKDFPEDTIRWSGPIQVGVPLIEYVPAQAFREDSEGFAEIAYETDPEDH